jgi:hypothetical protein
MLAPTSGPQPALYSEKVSITLSTVPLQGRTVPRKYRACRPDSEQIAPKD